MDEQTRRFLARLQYSPDGVKPQRLGITATREQDRARQKAKRDGLATFQNGRWAITAAGLAALNGDDHG